MRIYINFEEYKEEIEYFDENMIEELINMEDDEYINLREIKIILILSKFLNLESTKNILIIYEDCDNIFDEVKQISDNYDIINDDKYIFISEYVFEKILNLVCEECLSLKKCFDILKVDYRIKENIKKKIAIVFPFRDRYKNLSHMKNHIKYMELDYGKYEYKFYVINQNNDNLFAKGTLFNIFYKMFGGYFDMYILHDVDMLPINYDYSYNEYDVVQLTNYIGQFKYKKIYEGYTGGVISIKPNIFKEINGFPNLCVGWGGEDDILYFRLKNKNKTIKRLFDSIHKSELHEIIKNPRYSFNYDLYTKYEKGTKEEINNMQKKDGISNLKNDINYKIDSINEFDKNFFYIDIDFDYIYCDKKIKINFSNKNIIKNINILDEYNININIFKHCELLNKSSLDNKYIELYKPDVIVIYIIQEFDKNTINNIIMNIKNQNYKNYKTLIIFNNIDICIDVLNFIDERFIILKYNNDCLLKIFNEIQKMYLCDFFIIIDPNYIYSHEYFFELIEIKTIYTNINCAYIINDIENISMIIIKKIEISNNFPIKYINNLIKFILSYSLSINSNIIKIKNKFFQCNINNIKINNFNIEEYDIEKKKIEELFLFKNNYNNEIKEINTIIDI